MKRLMVNFFFPRGYDEVLFYTTYSHKTKNLFEVDCSGNINISSLRKVQNFEVIDAKKNQFMNILLLLKKLNKIKFNLTKVEFSEDKQF